MVKSGAKVKGASDSDAIKLSALNGPDSLLIELKRVAETSFSPPAIQSVNKKK